MCVCVYVCVCMCCVYLGVEDILGGKVFQEFLFRGLLRYIAPRLSVNTTQPVHHLQSGGWCECYHSLILRHLWERERISERERCLWEYLNGEVCERDIRGLREIEVVL